MTDLELYRRFAASADSGFASYLILLIGAACVSYFGLGRLLRNPPLFLSPITAYVPKIKKIKALKPLSGLWGALLVGTLLRLPQMDDLLWFDETFTAAVARLDLRSLFTVVLGDVHPPTNYLISWLTIRLFGSSEIALRLPALFAGVLLIYLTYRLALRLFGTRRVALLAAWIMAAMPAAIKYANEARQYALLVCLVFALMVAYLEGRRRWFVALGVLVAWTHNLGFVYLFIIGLMVMLQARSWRRPVLTSWVLAALWLPGLLYQSSEVANGFWLNFTWPGLLMPLFSMTLTNNLSEQFAIAAATPFLAVLGLSVVWAVPWLLSRRGLVWLALFAGVPLAVGLVSWLWTPVYLHRALLPSILALVPILAKFLVENQRARWLWRGLAAIGLLSGLVGFFEADQRSTEEGREMVELCAGADAIYNTGLVTQFMSAYYLPGVPSFLGPTAATDEGMHMPDSALDALGFQRSANPLAHGTDICALVINSPFNEGPEWIQQFLEPGSFESVHRSYSNYYAIDYYRIFVS